MLKNLAMIAPAFVGLIPIGLLWLAMWICDKRDAAKHQREMDRLDQIMVDALTDLNCDLERAIADYHRKQSPVREAIPDVTDYERRQFAEIERRWR